ncbi:MAG TPA: enoyl-CoA hydratase-related protein [Ideonella sp.]|nr:enoyl-CoA hydratase-related protein [Ideonella sp.]
MSLLFEIHDRVAVLTLDRPESANALDIATLKLLRQRLEEVRDRDDLLVAVITGRGAKSFCAGADLKKTTSSRASYAEGVFKSKDASSELGLYARLIDLNDLDLWKPVVAAVNGHCLGGGLELALQCDLRIASSNASFGLPEAVVASIPGVSGVHRLLKAIPAAQAMKMCLTGKPLGANEARDWGLVSDVVAPEALMPLAMELAGAIAANGPLAVQAIKKLARQTAHLSDVDAQQLTELYWGTLRDTEDRAEGRAAFAQKRRPKYAGR